MARPPIAQDRLERLPDGRVRFTMKKRWADGTEAFSRCSAGSCGISVIGACSGERDAQSTPSPATW